MGRPLDKDIIIKILERWQKAFKENSHYVSASDLSLVIKDVRELPTIQSVATDICVGDTISRQAAIDAIEKMNIPDDMCVFEILSHIEVEIATLPSAQPETAKRIVGKSRDGMTLWYQCDMCDEPVDEQDNYCRGCGRRLIDG